MFIPNAECCICNKKVRVIKQMTFSYWYCDTCKDERNVYYTNLVYEPRGRKSEWQDKESDDILIGNDVGIYRIQYKDGQTEFFELTKHNNKREVRLSGATVQSAFRINERDLPPRIKVQPTTETKDGDIDEGLLIWSLSD